MKNEVAPLFKKNISLTILLVFTGLWSLSWVLPWAVWLQGFPWLRLVISFVVFVAPGMAVSLMVAGQRFNLSTHFVSGLAISVFFIGLLGLMGRVLKLPFDSIKLIFALIGLIGLLILIKQFHANQRLYKTEKFSPITLILLLLMLLGFLEAFLNRAGGFGGDNLTYLAYLTNWQHAQPLGFKEIIYGSGSADWIRFWLTLFPMTTALLASMSNLHGILLLGFYLEPCLVVIAILSMYNLYEDLIQSKHLAIAAVFLHLAFFFLLQGSLQPGGTFFHRIGEDKVFAGFILAPMFFLAVRFLLENFTWKSIVFFFLIGTSLEFAHPVILAYSIFVAGIYAGIITISQRNYKKFIITSALLVFLILPAGSLRFIDAPWVSKNLLGLQYDLTKPGAFDLEVALHTGSIDNRISYIEGTPFYGFNPKKILIQIPTNKRIGQFLSWSYLWILIIGFLWSLINIKKNPIAPFITATSLLVLICIIPYTGWLVGYLVSARLLWRAPWLLPIGLMSVVLFDEALKFIYSKTLANKKIKISIGYVTFGLTVSISLIMISYFFINTNRSWYTAEKVGQNIKKLSDLAKLGDYLETNIDQPSTFLADSQTMVNLLPGLSSKAKIIYFRNLALSPYPIKIDKIREIFSQNPSITFEQRIDTLKQYDITYLLTQKTSLKEYYIQNSQFTALENVSGYWILHFLEKEP